MMETLTEEIIKGTCHITDWNCSNVSSGVYFYRITTPSLTIMKKMVLMR